MRHELIKNKFFVILFFFPLTYIFGIAIVESFILLFLLFLGVNYKSISLPDGKILLLLLLFSLYVGVNASLQITDNLKYSSIFHFRYVLFSIAVFYFFEKYFDTKLNKKLVIFMFFGLILLLIFDSIFQFFVGENIFGQKLYAYRVSSFFGEDLILGSFLIRLLPIIFWYLFYLKIDLNKNQNYLVSFFSLYFITIYLSGERTSFALLIGLIFLSFIFIFNLRKLLILSSIGLSIFIICAAIFNFGKIDITSRMFLKTYKQVFIINNNQEEKIQENENNFLSILKTANVFSNDHQGHIILSKKLFMEKPIFGSGPKGFRHYCRSVNYSPDIGICSTHPHNILAQTFSELGLMGLIFYLLFCVFLIKNLFLIKNKNYKNYVSSGFLITSIGILIHLFPFLPSGNFFNNWISSFIYFKIGLLFFSYKKLFS